ncbi:MAG: BamA/TamA family outer membrane protein [Candidatus Aminicenantes bacterium]|nr:BamA/TamA family outer membrane protein [Candidatus Aminicenantes bacterium]
MHKKIFAVFLFLIFFSFFTAKASARINPVFDRQEKAFSSLRILTINVWSGLNYKGTLRMGEYESKEMREKRFRLLVKQIQNVKPDVIFLQEANPVGRYGARLARALKYDKIHQVALGGVKLGPLGIPTNLKEGNAILARPELHLKLHDVWKLSGSFGLFGDILTFHFDESIFALAGRILVDSRPVFLVNTHLVASPLVNQELMARFESLIESKQISEDEYQKALKKHRSVRRRREKEIVRLAQKIKGLPAGAPVILGGDFNVPVQAPEMRVLFQEESERIHFLDSYMGKKSGAEYTWNPSTNNNIQLALKISSNEEENPGAYEMLSRLDEKNPKRIDHILLSQHFSPESIKSWRVVLDTKEEGIHVSDHYGVLSEMDLHHVLAQVPREEAKMKKTDKAKFEFLPILMWDTDIGVGYGIKLFYFNPFRLNESFDLVLFNSTKGERWYRLVFSWPDFERRQGKKYPISFDIMLDYDKYLKNNFFGIGSGSAFEDREKYTREPFEITLTASRGFSPTLVGQFGLRYKTVDNYNFEENSRLVHTPPELNTGRATVSSLYANLRFDTRDSFINPSSGLVLQGEAEFAFKTSFANFGYKKIAGWIQYYKILLYPKTVMALRLNVQNLFGENIPVQFLLPIGGGSTLRGSPQDRYLGKASAVFNGELRFPLFWRFGGVVGFDAGKVWDSLGDFDFKGWAANPTVGLRFYMSQFLVRLDIGLGKDSTGLYFNFGHVF